MNFWGFSQIDVVPVWNAWGHALIRMERYAQARVKFKYVEFMLLTNVSDNLCSHYLSILSSGDTDGLILYFLFNFFFFFFSFQASSSIV